MCPLLKNCELEVSEYVLGEEQSANSDGKGRWGGALLWSRFSREVPVICFLRRGVICDVHEIPELGILGARALICADRLKTDAGGLAIVRDQAYEDKLNDLLSRYQALCDLENRVRL